MKSFDEWFNKEYSNYGDSYKELYDENSDSYKSEFVDDRYGAFQAGQQSKQAEVDELRKRIDVLTGKVNEMAHIFLDDLEEILKGDQS